MNVFLVPFYLSILTSLASAMFYQPCDCPQCNQYTLKVQRCTCCVYLLNGKRSADSKTVVHNQGIYKKSTHGKFQDDWQDNFIEDDHETENKEMKEWYDSQINKRRNMPTSIYERIGLKLHPGSDKYGAFILDIDGF